MAKYDAIPITVHTARVVHTCLACGKLIVVGQKVAYRKDKMINQMASRKKYCEDCFNGYGHKVTEIKATNRIENQKKLGGK